MNNFYVLPLTLSITLIPLPGLSQVIPDNSLGANSSQLEQNVIKGGLTQNENLFHSFEEFGISPTEAIYFANPAGINNIFSRITGNKPSNIEGILGVQGNARLFFLNPNGIIFGPNAQINVPGGLIGTTAQQVDFQNGQSWGIDTAQTPRLTVKVPVGLGFTSKSRNITIKDRGHNVALASPNPTAPHVEPPPQIREPGLDGIPGQTIALLGNGIKLEGAIIRIPSGQLDIASIETGNVGIDLSNELIEFDYSQVENFSNINLNQRSLLSASGNPSGTINIWGNNYQSAGNSLIFSSNFGKTTAGNINLNLTNDISFLGNTNSAITNNNLVTPGIRTQSFSAGKGGNIIVNGNTLTIKNFSGIVAQTFGNANSGKINIDAEQIVIDGTPPLPELLAISVVGTSSSGKTGNAGDIQLSGDNLTINKGGIIVSQSLSQGNTGNIEIIFSEKVTVKGNFSIGTSTEDFFSSSISTNSIIGNVGDIKIATPQLEITEGGQISATGNGIAEGGNITINTDSVLVDGKTPGQDFRGTSQISTTIETPTPQLQALFGFPPVAQGNSGDLTINSNTIELSNEGTLRIENQGIGNGGNLLITAQELKLDHNAQITGQTREGSGGNLFINADLIQLNQNSRLTTTAETQGRGGKITINSRTLVGENNSDILANAQQGPGGDITINSNQVFGFTVRQETNNPNLEQFQTNKINDIAAISAVNPELSGQIRFQNNQLISSFELLPIDLAPQGSLGLNNCFNRSNQATRFKVLNTQNNQPSPNRITPSFEPGDPIVEGNTLIPHPEGDHLYLVKQCKFSY